MSDFVHLHVHSEYSLLDGLPHPKDIVARAAELQQPALALTDHGAMYAAIEFYDACKAKGINPIIGIEAYLARRGMKDRDAKDDRSSYHLLLLAENNTGYQNLLKLVSAAELEGFYYYPRVDHEFLAQHSEGLICTTGCPSGEVPRLWNDGRQTDARKQLGWYKEVFKDRFYVELQEHGIAEFANLNRDLVQLASEFDLPLVATNDAHYLRPEDANAQDVLLCIQTGTVVTDPKRMRMDGSDYYLKSSDEMRAIWREVPAAIANTVAIAERCKVDLDFKEFHLPVFPVPAGYDAKTYLRYLCDEGFKKYYPAGNPAALERLEYELGVIHQMGFDTYFLIVWDLIRAARERNIWYNVRGSAAGSMAAYCAGITNLDPIRHKLIFERFLNPGRISMPDIDLDFQDDRRAELIEYTVQKYGRDNVAQIVTFGTLGAKASIRDVGRALDYPLSEVDRVAKMLPTGPNIKLDDCLEKIPEFKQVYEESDYIHKLIDNARLLEGVARNAGTHAAGVVVADRPIVEYAPLHRPTKSDSTGGFPVVEFEMNWLERVGLLKMDYLGLASLTIMRRACELIEKRHGVSLDLGNIPTEDPKAFELLARGDVTGVFQVEGAGMRKVLQQLRPTKFDHVVATISLYRPGPIEKIPNYINRLHGSEKITYDHPALKPILEETLGVMVFQEQIIQMAMSVAGYTASEADLLRKAVGKKDKEKLLKEHDRFVDRAEKLGVIPREIADKLFNDVEFFARYGFNRAHAADYALLTCQTAFLKANYPIEFMTALLTTETGDIEKVGMLVGEMRRAGIDVSAPNVNTSDVDFTIAEDNHGIHFALRAVKNVGAGAVQVIVDARKKGGPFKSLDDFCRRVDLRLVNRRVLESLIKAGGMDQFGRRSQLLKVLDRMLSASQAAHQASDRGQLSMFGTMAATAGMGDTFGTLPDEAELPNRDKLAAEKELTGAYFSDNPLLRLAKGSRKGVSHMVNQLDESLAKQSITIAGVITSARVITTKKGDPMAFVQLEDPTGSTEITVFPRPFARTRELWQVEALALVRGKVELRDGKLQVLCDSAEEYQPEELPADSAAGPANNGNSGVVTQFAMPNAEELALAEAASTLGQSTDESFDDLPKAPEEPPSEFWAEVDQPSIADQSAGIVNSAHTPEAVAAPSGIPAKGNGSASIPIQTDTSSQAHNGNGEAKSNNPSGAAVLSMPNLYNRAAELSTQFQQAKHLRIFLERTNDHDEDVRRMRELLALLSSADGRDRFSFYVRNPQGIVQLDFPNHSTSYHLVEDTLNELMVEWGTLEVQ